MRIKPLVFLLPLVLALVSCGGGSSPDAPPPFAVPQSVVIDTSLLRPADSPALPQAAPGGAVPQAAISLADMNALMNWAQRQYPQFFPGAPATLNYEQFTYRFYPSTGNYLALTDGQVYIMGPVSGGPLTRVGAALDFACNVYPENCGLLPDALKGIPTASIVLNDSSTMGFAKLTADTTSLKVAYKPGDGSELLLNTKGETLQLLVDATKKSTVLRDTTRGTKTVFESGPKGDLVRVFSTGDVFVEGYWVENRKLYKLRANSSTEPGNLTFIKNLPAKKAALQVPQAADGSCGQLIQQYTGDAQDYMERTGEALEESGEVVGKRVSKVSKIWRLLVQNFCGSGQQSGYTEDEQRAINLEMTKALGGKTITEIVDRAQKYQDIYNDLVTGASAIKNALDKVSKSIKDTYRVPDRVTEGTPLNELQTSPATAVAQQKVSVPPTKVYTSTSLGCLNVNGAGSGWALSNGCSEAIRAGYCTTASSGSTACTINSYASLLKGESRSVSGTGVAKIWVAACPAFFSSQPVQLNQEGNQFWCYYTSSL